KLLPLSPRLRVSLLEGPSSRADLRAGQSFLLAADGWPAVSAGRCGRALVCAACEHCDDASERCHGRRCVGLARGDLERCMLREEAGTILLVGPRRPWFELVLRGGLTCCWGLRRCVRRARETAETSPRNSAHGTGENDGLEASRSRSRRLCRLL